MRAAGPGGPPRRPVVGNLPDARRDFLDLLERCARHGDVAEIRLGPQRVLVLSHPDLAQDVLVERRHDFVKNLPYRVIARVTGEGLVVSEGRFWQRERRLMQPAFHHDRVLEYAQTMAAYTSRWMSSLTEGSELDIHREFMNLTLEIVAKVLFDADVRGQAEREVGQAVTVALSSLERVINSLSFLLPGWMPTPTNLRVRGAVRRLDRVVYGIIDRRRADGRDRGDLLSLLLAARDEDGSPMPVSQVRNEAMTLFLAGHETTAIALAWATYLLSENPQAQERLVEELNRELPEGPPAPADVSRLRYAGAVVRETLRLYPPAFALGRRAVRDLEVAGHAARRGTNVIVSPWIIQRDPRWFDEPLAFRPERWLDGSADDLPRFAYFPFGGGQRMCIGSGFAEMEAALVLATVARAWSFRCVPGRRVAPHAAFTLRPENGIAVTPVRRSGALIGEAGARAPAGT